MVKPSELAPATRALLAELLPRPVEAVAVVEGAAEETTALLAQRFDHLFCTGYGAVGRIVAAAAARNLTPTTLELGGRSPVFVDESTDMAGTAHRLVWGTFTNAGQTRVAPDYVLVTPGARDSGELMARAAEHPSTRPALTPGVIGPTEAFGLDTLRRACAEIGLRTVQPRRLLNGGPRSGSCLSRRPAPAPTPLRPPPPGAPGPPPPGRSARRG